MPKDLFSDGSKSYALYRPTYPKELFEYILSFVANRKCAWDCATGNGQAALALANYFEKVMASDISEKQLQQAPQKNNIEYVVCSAEKTPFEENSFDLITVAQAYHWLNWEQFHTEIKRVAKPDCVVAVWMYDLLKCEDDSVSKLIQWFYKEITGPYWDKERKHVDDHYAQVSFNFESLPSKEFFIETRMNPESLLGYFSSWSAVQNYIKSKGTSPVELVKEELRKEWIGKTEKRFVFPIYLKIGRAR